MNSFRLFDAHEVISHHHRTHCPPAKPSNWIASHHTHAILICILYIFVFSTVVRIQYLYSTSLNSNTHFLQTSHRALRGCVARNSRAKKSINIQNVFLSLHPNKNNKTKSKRGGGYSDADDVEGGGIREFHCGWMVTIKDKCRDISVNGYRLRTDNISNGQKYLNLDLI